MTETIPPARLWAGNWLRLAAICGFLLTLAAGMLVPVYTDEIGWRFQERAWVDGVDKSFNDSCGLNTLAHPPWFMLPIRWFSAAANQAFADPWFIRVEGLLCALAWTGMLWLLMRRLESDRSRPGHVQTLIFALLGLGTLPFLMVLSRPEQPLILTFTLMVLIGLARPTGLGDAALAWLKAAGIVLLAVVAASYHMKGVAFAPVALACLAVCAAGRTTVLPRAVMGIVLIAAMVTAANYWIGRFQCPGDLQMAAMLGQENLASVVAGHGQLGNVFAQVVRGMNPLNYVWLAVPDVDMSAWLPADVFPAPVRIAVTGALTLLWGIAIGLAVLRLASFVIRRGWRGVMEPCALLAAAILACVLIWGASQINRNPYEAGQILPMLAVFFVLCFTLPQPETPWHARAMTWLTWLAVPTALLSQAALLIVTGGPLIAASRVPGYLPEQRFSVSIADYGSVRRDIHAAMNSAGIPSDRLRHGLMVDDITYLALQRDLLPYHRLGVLEGWNAGIDNPAQYLIDRNSDGVVAACANLPINFEAIAARSGEICAISRANLEQLAAPPPSIWDEEAPPAP